MDIDNRFTYSTIVSAKIAFPVSLHIYPIPAKGNIQIESAVNTRISIFNTTGIIVKIVFLKKGRNETDISEFPAGTYFIRQTSSSETFKFQVLR